MEAAPKYGDIPLLSSDFVLVDGVWLLKFILSAANNRTQPNFY